MTDPNAVPHHTIKNEGVSRIERHQTVAACEAPLQRYVRRIELILALDLYVRSNGNPTGQDFEAVDEVSAILNKLHRIMGNATGDTLRNRNGVYLKVMNFRSSDPHYLNQGKVGMTRGNALEGVIWQEYAGDSGRLATDAQAIRATHPSRRWYGAVTAPLRVAI